MGTGGTGGGGDGDATDMNQLVGGIGICILQIYTCFRLLKDFIGFVEYSSYNLRYSCLSY